MFKIIDVSQYDSTASSSGDTTTNAAILENLPNTGKGQELTASSAVDEYDLFKAKDIYYGFDQKDKV